jgi:hypothetical protein
MNIAFRLHRGRREEDEKASRLNLEVDLEYPEYK